METFQSIETMVLIPKKEAAYRMGRTPNGLSKYIKRNPDFPKKIKDGVARQSPVYFVEDEINKWILSKR